MSESTVSQSSAIRTRDTNGSIFDIAPAFAPAWFARGGHAQTIVGAFWPYRRSAYAAQQLVIRLFDGDSLVLHDDRPATWKLGDPTAILLHGLGGSHKSGYVVRSAAKLNALGVRTFRLDLRGCGAGYRLARRPVHAGRSDDAAAALDCVRKSCPASPIVLIGFSMGGNHVLKLAGEYGDDVPAPLAGVLAIGPPVDLEACSRKLATRSGRIYDRNFLRKCREAVARKRAEVPEAFYREPPKTLKTLREFDDCFTAPLSGFADVEEYYFRCSAARVSEAISVPTAILAADDDPIVPADSIAATSWSRSVSLTITRGGGHLGYLSRAGIDPDRHWLDWRVIEWAQAALADFRKERE